MHWARRAKEMQRKAYSWNNAKLDTESYKMSRYSDMEVTNQFDVPTITLEQKTL